MDIRVASLTDTGRARTNNEDSLLADSPLFAIADGMGGHAYGEVASSMAVEVLQGWKDRLEGSDGREAAEKLREAFNDANRTVFEKGREDENLAGMGTTLTAAWVSDDNVAIAHIGDSRAYLLRGGLLQQLTEDQNVAQEMVRRGRITPEEAASSPQRHIVLQAIGAETAGLDVAIATTDLRPGDKLILASDGLFGMLPSNEEIRDILLGSPDIDAACRALIDAANEAGGSDNITVVIVEVDGEPVAGAPGDDGEVVVDRGESVAAPPRRGTGRGPRTWLVIGGAVAVLAAMAVLFLTRSSEPSYVVSTRDGIVVVLDGRVGDATTPARGEVVERFNDERLSEFPSPVQRRFRTGLEVDSIEEARLLVERQPRIQGPRDTPTPETPTPDPGASPATPPPATPRTTP